MLWRTRGKRSEEGRAQRGGERERLREGEKREDGNIGRLEIRSPKVGNDSGMEGRGEGERKNE